MELAVAFTLATPEKFVAAVGLESVALAPDEGAVKVTVAPLTGLPPPSVTVTCNAVVNCVPTAALCVPPPVAAMNAGTPDDGPSSATEGCTTPLPWVAGLNPLLNG